jgi:hypothetical protein
LVEVFSYFPIPTKASYTCQWGLIVRRFPPLMLAAKIGLGIILCLFVAELVLLSQHLGEGAEHISGSILDGISIDKSQFISTKHISNKTILPSTKHTISFIVKVTNTTGKNIQGGTISIAFQQQGQYIADPATTTFDLPNGASKLITMPWKPAIELDATSCTMITTVYDAANDELGSLNEPLTID